MTQSEIDQEWKLVQAAQRNPAAFRPLYEKYYVPIYRFVLKRTADEALAKDVTSQAFLKAMDKIGQYEHRGLPFSAWLYRIAANEVTQYYRQNKKNRVVCLKDEHVGLLVEEAYDSDFEERKKEMLRLLSELKEEDMQLVELRFFEERSFREVAEIMDITENNAKVRAHRILQRMRKKAREG